MVSARRPLVAGNWKMNGWQRSTAELAKILTGARALAAKVDLLVCPPATLVSGFAALASGSPVAIGAQDCHVEPAGAFTGDISAEMLKDAGAERAAGHTNAVVRTQMEGSLPDGATDENLVVAYEPVWAIGTGLTPTPADVAEVHGIIRARLGERYGAAGQGVRILYGGSVKSANAAELMRVANVDGALVGGASLKAEEFLGILNVYR